MEKLWQDLRYGARMLLKSPGLTLVAVLALALGIGANTAIFSVVNGVLLNPLPYSEPDRLAMLWEDNTSRGFDRDTPAPANFVDWRDQNQSFEEMAAYVNASFNLTGTGDPERVEGYRVSEGFFDVLGAGAQLGRVFLPEEDRPGAPDVAIISNGLWQRRFGGDPAIVGSSLSLNGHSFVVVGVMPAHFQFPTRESDVWIPAAFDSEEARNRSSHYLEVVARLKPGVTLEQAQADLSTIASRLEQQYPVTNTGVGAAVVSLHEQYVGDIRPALLVLLGAVGFVLLIACANVANLLLARTASRQKEIAIKTALGAGRARIVGQLLTESVLLSVIGGAAGLLLAVWGVKLLVAIAPGSISQVKTVEIDARVLVFTFAVSVLTGLIFGLAPASQVSKTNLSDSLKEGSRAGTSDPRRSRVRSLLVVSEVALAMVLLVGAGLMINSFVRLNRVQVGFNPDRLLTMRMNLPQSKYSNHDRRLGFYDGLLERVKALPGVESAAMITFLPLTFPGGSSLFSVEGRAAPPAGEEPLAVNRSVTPDYFRTMGIPLVSGRVFDSKDRQDSQPVVIINRAMAERYWPGEEPIGKRLKLGYANSPSPWATIVGVIGDVRQFELIRDSKPEMYRPYTQERGWFAPRDLVVRTSSDPLSFAAAVRSQVWAVDGDQAVYDIKTMEQVVSGSISKQRFNMTLFGVFAGVAILLAAVGIYGVMSYTVTQRTHEIGIRMALGARPGGVLKLVIAQGMKPALAGVAIGAVSALALTRVMSSLLYGVSATDPVTFIIISVVLAGVALAACFVPARRATKVDPMIALRYE